MKTRSVIEFSDRHVKLFQSSVGRDGAWKMNCCEVRDLKDMKSLPKIRTETLEVMIPSRHVTMHYADFPSQDTAEIRRMIELQITRFTPHAREDVIFDFLIMETAPSGYSRVLLMLVPGEVIARYLSLLEEAGVVPFRLTINAAGLRRWCSSETSSVLIHVDDGALDMCFCRRGRMSFIRSVPFDAGTVTEDIRKAVEIYETEVEGEPPEKILLLVPDKARAASLKKTLEERYRCQVETLYYPPDMPGSDPSISYFAVLGAVRQSGSCSLNFLPPEMKVRHRRRIRQKQWLTSGLLTAAICVFCFIVLAVRMHRESVYAAHLQDRSRQMSLLAQRITDIKEHTEFIEKEVFFQVLIADVFRQLSLLMPEAVWLESFHSQKEGQYVLKGFAGDDTGVNQFYRNLVTSDVFSDVVLEYSKKRKIRTRELTEFRVRCAVTGKRTPR